MTEFSSSFVGIIAILSKERKKDKNEKMRFFYL